MSAVFSTSFLCRCGKSVPYDEVYSVQQALPGLRALRWVSVCRACVKLAQSEMVERRGIFEALTRIGIVPDVAAEMIETYDGFAKHAGPETLRRDGEMP